MPTRTLSILIRVAAFGLILTQIFYSFGDTLSGDITGDGAVNGRDALKVMRASMGLETVTDEEIAKGDVSPIPGLNGRRIGDGKLTREDAELILQQSVGLLPDGTFTGDYSQSPPVIDDFYPQSGPEGTAVSLEGKNFLGGLPDENLVFFGGILAPIHAISGTRIVTEVPAGAETGLITVWTPGGKTESYCNFCVTKLSQGKLVLGQGLNPSDFTIVSSYGESAVNADGSFKTPLLPSGLTLLGAVSNSDSNNTYFALIPPSLAASAASITIDALSTAKALIFLHPFFMTMDSAMGADLLSKMDSIPEVKMLADVIARRYSNGANGLEDSEVNEAWQNAVRALIGQIPDVYNYTFDTQAGKILPMRQISTQIPSSRIVPEISFQASVVPFDEDDANPVRIYNVDRDYLQADYESEGRYINMSLFSKYSPLDWIVGLSKIDPESMPLGLNTSFLKIQSTGYSQLGYSRSTLVAANQWTARIDIAGYFVGLALGLIPKESFNLPNNEEGVYLVRAYSGAVRDYEGLDNKAIQSIPNGEDLALSALLDNLCVSLIDLWGAFIGGDRSFLQKTVLKVLQSSMTATTRAQFKSVLEGTDTVKLQMIMTLLVSLGEGIRIATLEQGLSAPKEKVISTFKTALSKSLSILETLRVISCVGKCAERIAGLMGYLINPLGMELSPGPTPLETFLVIVGDPFGPKLSNVSPLRGGEGAEVTITGERFAPKLTDNHVFFGDEEAKILSGDPTKLVVQVPITTQGVTSDKKVTLSVETPASSNRVAYKDSFTIIRAPYLTSLNAEYGFAPNPSSPSYYPNFSGTIVTAFGGRLIQVEGELPYEVHFGSLYAPIGQTSDLSLSFTVPNNATQGNYAVHIYDPRSGLNTKSINFRVVGAPLINGVTPDAAQAGQLVEIGGKELTGSAIFLNDRTIEPIVATDTRIQFIFPTYITEGEKVKIFAVNPAGKSAEKTITRLAGVQVPQLPTLNSGYYLDIRSGQIGTLRDGKLSLDEIAQFLSNQLDLASWDDKNEKVIQVWSQRKDDTGNYFWLKTDEFSDTPDKENNGTKEHETRQIWRWDNYQDGTVNKYLSSTVDLDATEDQMEEADFLNYYGTDPKTYGQEIKSVVQCQVDGAVESNGFSLPPQTELTIPNSLHVDGGITLSDGCKVRFGHVTMKKTLEMKANSAVIYSGTFSSSSSTAIQIVDGFGNIIGNTNNYNYNSVWVSFSGNNGIEITGGGKNTILADIRDCPGYGLSTQMSEQNTYKYTTIANCTKGGISSRKEKYSTWNNVRIEDGAFGMLLDQGTGNVITSGFIVKNCAGTGLTIQGGALNIFGNYYSNFTGTLTIQNCGQMGISLNRTESNLFGNAIIEGCKGTGLQIGPDASANTFQTVSVLDCDNGIVLTGTGTLLNTFNYVFSGAYYRDTWIAKGNRKIGISILDGANNNLFANSLSLANQGHGVLIEGENTHTNTFNECGIGCGSRISRYSAPILNPGNGGDGILLQKGAHHNKMNTCEIVGSGGNGITIQDKGANENTVENCLIGSDSTQYNKPPTLKPNRGYGIVARNEANGTIIDSNTLGANLQGNVWIDKSQPISDDQMYSTTISNNSSCIESTAYTQFLADPEFAKIERIGAYISNSSRVSIQNNSFGLATRGLVVDGTNSGHHFIAENSITGASECVHIENSVGDTLYDIYSSGGKGIGFAFIRTANTRNALLVASNCGGNALFMEGCNDVVINDSQFTFSKNGNDGVVIVQSENISLQSSKIQGMPGTSLLLDSCRKVELDRVDIFDGTTGIFIYECDDVTILGHPINNNDPDRFNKAITWVKGPAIHIFDSRKVSIGSSNHHIRLFTNDEQGIFIEGDTTDTVSIMGCLIYQNKQEGIRVEGGKNISIGGTMAENYIYYNLKDGILAQGNNTGVSIHNNQIGVSEEGGILFNTQNGIALQDGIHHASIVNNQILSNRQNGILISGGAHHNQIGFNIIMSNVLNGILVDGATTLSNQITRNLITKNYQLGIKLQGGNNNVSAPTVNVMTDQVNNLIGHIDAPDGSIVEIFSDPYDEGEQLVATTYVFYKNFSTSATLPLGQNIHATITYPDGNTSQFGPSIVSSKGSTDNQTFVFSSDAAGQKDIYYKTPSQEIPVRLTNDPSTDEDPQLSSQGRYITFTSDRNGNRDIWVMSSSGQQLSQITTHPAADYQPAWQPGGDQILFVSERDGNPEIYQVKVNPTAVQGEIGPGEKTLDTTKEGYSGAAAGDAAAVRFTSMSGVLSYFMIYITADPAPFAWKVFSYENGQPGNTVIAEGTANPDRIGWNIVETNKAVIPENFLIAVYFLEAEKPKIGLSYGGMTYYWWTYTAQTNTWKSESYVPYMIRAFVQAPDPIRITNNNAADIEPAWSPDRTQIAFTSTRGGNTDIWIANADGSAPRQLTDGKGKNTNATWSPNSGQLAFVSDRDGNQELYLIHADGTGLIRLTNDPGIDTDPAWNQTGTRVLHSSNRDSGMEIYSLMPGTGKSTRLTISTGNAVEPHASPGWIGSTIAYFSIDEEKPVVTKPSPGRLSPSSVEARLLVSSGTANEGDQIPIEVTLEGAENLGNLAFDLHYNPAVVSLADIPLNGLSVNPLFAINPEEYPSLSGVVRFNGVYATGLSGAQPVMKLFFDIDRNAPVDQSTIAVVNLQGCDIGYADIPLMAQDGIITIIRDTTGVQSWMLY